MIQQVTNESISHAKTNETEVAMGGIPETKDVVNDESKREEQPQTFELKKNGYLALGNLQRGMGSGVYETGITTQASGGLDIFNMHNRDIAGGFGDDILSLRQSSIDTEPHTLATVSVRHAKDGAVEIIETYDEEEAIHLFLKDAKDEHLREEALAAILPVASELVT